MFALGVFFCLARLAYGQATPTSLNRVPPQPQATICGDIVNDNLYDHEIAFEAKDVFDCLTSVPFNSAVALRFLQYVNQTFQFQANTGFIRDAPAEYQQPPVDFFGSLQDIANHVIADQYKNQYAFEWDVQTLLQQMHDGHVAITGGISPLFSFLLPGIYFVSVSPDGKQQPQIYVLDDLERQLKGRNGHVASPVTEINNVPAEEWLTTFAAHQSVGYLEPNADWNNMMWSPAQNIFGLSVLSEYAPFYTGDRFVIKYQNGTEDDNNWYALYNSPGYTGPLQTGGDFYNFFVLGLLPANFMQEANKYYRDHTSNGGSIDVSGGYSDAPNDTTSWHGLDSAYPANTIAHQEDLGEFSSGSVTGYFLPNISTAVLSIPTFEMYGTAIDTFGDAVTSLITNATRKKADKLIIDLQQNGGGDVALAFSLFNQLFPNARPFAGSRMRSHDLANVLGDAYTSHFDNLRQQPGHLAAADAFEGYEWVVTDRINAETGQNFTSWAEFYGPIPLHGEDSSRIQRYDLSNPVFVSENLGIYYPESCVYSATCNDKSPWEPENIVLLTDGLCASTCSLFLEMMREAGAQSVVVGGKPEGGPMQAASGTRGAVEYSGYYLDQDYQFTAAFNGTAAARLPDTPSDTGMYLTYTGIGLRSQFRQGQTLPDQVLYLPASCRLYWTFANIFDYDRLWTDVYNAAFVDNSLCVPGSLNVTTAPTRPSSPPSQSLSFNSRKRRDSVDFSSFNFSRLPDHELPEDVTFSPDDDVARLCGRFPPGDRDPRLAWPCNQVNFPCKRRLSSSSDDFEEYKLHASPCQNAQNTHCFGPLICNKVGQLQNGKKSALAFVPHAGSRGFCVPQWTQSDANTRCDDIDNGASLNKVLRRDRSRQLLDSLPDQ